MSQLRSIAVLTALVVIAFLLGARARGVDPGVHERYTTDLARLESLDHRLNEDLMRARTGLLANYDPLVVTMRELRAIHARLEQPPEYLGVTGQRELGEAVRRSTVALAEQASLLERFKSENAILLNSLRYLPSAADELTDQLRDPILLAQVDALVRDVLVLNLWNDRELATGVRETLATLTEGLPTPPAELELVRIHTLVVIDRRPRVQHLLEQILDLHASRDAYRLDELYRAHHATAARRGQTDDIVLFVVALLSVLGIATLVILRMREAARALGKTSDELAAAVDTKNRFVAMTSHEFRTPLSVILSSVELLEAYSDRWGAEKKQTHYERIRGSIAGMSQLIDGVLLIGRGDAGVLDFKPAPTDLERIVLEVLAALKARTGDPRVVEVVWPETANVVADERLLRHILDNLLSNAVKYSPAGGAPRLELQVRGERLVMIVADEGIGIPESDLGTLFGSFQRGSNVGAIPGTGLGLAVVKRAAELHGGTVRVESDLDEGTTFEVDVRLGGNK